MYLVLPPKVMESNLWHGVIADILATPRHNYLHIKSSLLISFNHPLVLSYHRESVEGKMGEAKALKRRVSSMGTDSR